MLIFGLVGQAFALDLPEPVGYVNDFAKILPSSMEKELETKISNYEKKTSVEIAVVTVKSLKGLEIEEYSIKLAEKWKVGKKGKDNGIIFLIAPKERKMRIEVGYGLEGDMPDLKAKDIIDDVGPYFKQGDFPEGITLGVNSIIKTLGTETWDEREERIKQERIEQEKAREAMTRTAIIFGIVFLVLVFIGLIITAVYFLIIRPIVNFFRERAELNERKESAYISVDNIEEEIKEIEDMIKTKPKEIDLKKDLPQEYKVKIINLIVDATKKLRHVKTIFNPLPDLVDTDIDAAQSDIKSCQSSLSEAAENIDQVNSLIIKFEEYKRVAPIVIVEVETELVNVGKKFESLKKQGYRFNFGFLKAKKDITQTKGLLKDLNDKSKEGKINPKNIYDQTEQILLKLRERTALIEESLRSESDVNTNIPKIRQRIIEISGKELPNALKVLSQLQKENPQNPVKDLMDVERGNSLLVSAGNILRDAEKENSMEIQRFTEAASKIRKVKNLVEHVESVISGVYNRQAEIDQAKQEAPQLVNQLKKVFKKAERECNDSDVGSSAKSKLEEAESKFEEVQEASSSSSINWLAFIALVTAAIVLAKKAFSEAQSDIEDAEKRRRRQRRSSSYSSSWSSSGSSSSSSSSSSFGGGSFGGGGASGGW